MVENLFLVLTNPIEGEDEAFNNWYDTQHVPEVLDVPGVIAASGTTCLRSQFRRMKISPREFPPPHTPLSRCVRTGSRTRQVMAELLKRVMAGQLSLGETLDLSTISLAGWTPRGDRRVAGG